MFLFVGSGDIKDLLAGAETKSHRNLWMKFIASDPPHYNAIQSPIDALRTGAILEDRYFEYLPNNYLSQVVVYNKEMDALKVTLDFPLIDGSSIVDFDELKTVNFDDFLLIEQLRDAPYNEYISFIKKRYSTYYNQIQSQLYTTGLSSANLAFLCVYSYEDADNMTRVILNRDVVKFNIQQDNEVILLIKNRLEPFQQVKNYYKKIGI